MSIDFLFDSSGRQKHLPACILVIAVCLLGCLTTFGQGDGASSSQILQDLDSFREMGSVLYVAAHPDDENNQLIAYLARGRHYRTAYLSLTRGDGGQNVLGPEFGNELGLIRTEELLAARNVDGGRQYFSRALDFGFSKDYSETLSIWDREEVLSDTVRVIREFRPDVVITRFSLIPGGTHGHHTASAMLALEAFKMAGDPNAFPDQLRERLTPWQPKRILWNTGPFQSNDTNGTPLIRINTGGTNSTSGESYAEIAARSRSMHKTQGFGNFTGFRGSSGPRYESFELLAGSPAAQDILDGVNTTWSRVPGGTPIGEWTGDVIAKFNPQDPAASVPALLKIKKLLAGLAKDDPIVDEKRQQLDRIIQDCLGLSVETTIPQAEVVPGETLNLRLNAAIKANIVPVRWVAARYPSIKAKLAVEANLSPNTPVSRDSVETLPANTPISQPYWLREPQSPGMFRVADPGLIGRPENPPVFPIEQVFNVDGQTLIVPDQPVQLNADRAKGEPSQLEVISPVTLSQASDVELFAPDAKRPMTVTVTAARPEVSGTLRLSAPSSWQVSPATQSFHLAATGDQAQFTFTVTAPSQPATASITAEAEIDGRRYDNGRVVINYSHIPLLVLQPRADCKAVCLNLNVNAHNIGYLPGAGDNVAQSLTDMGCKVTTLTGADLTPERLKAFDAVVIGVRAFNVRTDLGINLPGLFAYVHDGGNVIEQYNRPGRDLKTDQLAPYSLNISSDRVTDPSAPVTLLVPDHAALNTPNKITSADFDGWVQERGTYYPDEWDAHWTPILACSDAGEAPLKGGLLIAQYGKGYFVYSGLVFFRQLPAGVPGSYRLFANLISLGK
ncbi:MAG TPA: PIG-L family deacetylase [Pseudomonadales bacterium]|nr:PIG-L family deacetylase [Pseudomonadales bacterium]